jgi:hypothetical protein
MVQSKKQAEEWPVELHPIPGLPSLFTSSSPWSEDSHPSEGRIAQTVATGFLIVVLAVAGVVLFHMFRPKVGDSLIHLGEKINGFTKLQPQNSSPPSSAQVPALSLPASEAKRDASEKGAMGSENSALAFDSTKQVVSEGSEAAVPSTKEPSNPSPSRASPNAAQDRSAEATRLWSAVASGNSSAEVSLARLYLRGDGVPRNCEQARVLLRAAVKAGSAEARLQLKKLRTRGCG